jgi:hypothetical protein
MNANTRTVADRPFTPNRTPREAKIAYLDAEMRLTAAEQEGEKAKQAMSDALRDIYYDAAVYTGGGKVRWDGAEVTLVCRPDANVADKEDAEVQGTFFARGLPRANRPSKKEVTIVDIG